MEWGCQEERKQQQKFFTYRVVFGVTTLHAAAMLRPTSLRGCTIAIVDRIGTTQ